MKNISKIAKRLRPIQGIWITGLLFVLAVGVLFVSPLQSHAVSCGDTITTNTTLTKNITHCSAFFGSALTIGASNITLNCKGHTISGTNANASVGLFLNSVTGVIVQNCKITGFASGFTLLHSDNNFLIKNTAAINGLGFDISFSNNNILQSNTANNNSDQNFVIDESNNNILQSNTVTNGGQGIFIIGPASNNTITGNTVNNNANKGIWLSGSALVTPSGGVDGNTLSGNIVSNNGEDGIFLDDASNNTLIKNIVSNNNIGFSLSAFPPGNDQGSSNNNTFIRNKAFSNGTDFTQDSLSTDNVCIKNNFSCN